MQTYTLSYAQKKTGFRTLKEAGLDQPQNVKRIPHCICREDGMPYA
jgi:hypothetical protein